MVSCINCYSLNPFPRSAVYLPEQGGCSSASGGPRDPAWGVLPKRHVRCGPAFPQDPVPDPGREDTEASTAGRTETWSQVLHPLVRVGLADKGIMIHYGGYTV